MTRKGKSAEPDTALRAPEDRDVIVKDYFRNSGRAAWITPIAVVTLAGLLFSAAILVAPLASARALSVHVLLSNDAAYYAGVEQTLRDVLSREQPDIVVTTHLLDQVPQSPPANGAYMIAIGTPATEYALTHYTDTPLLSLFVPKSAWDQLLTDRKHAAPVGAVVIDQPVSRSLALGELLAPSAKNVATVLGKASREQLGELKREALRRHLSLRYAELDEGDDPLSILTPIVESADIFIAIPDHGVFNRATAKWVLYLGFRQQIPVIGFSRSYSEAGALASVFSTPQNIGQQGGELVLRLVTGDHTDVWQTHYPRYYTLHTNKVVARALGIPLPDQATLYRMYAAALARQP